MPEAPTQQAASGASDEALLLRIANDGDREAYTELYRRYQRPAYSLACYLTPNAALAEDAFQEGMLRVWLYAKSHRADGNPRGWILRTVAREAIKRAVSAQKDKRTMSLDEDRDAPHARERGTPGIEAEELSAGLRRSLEGLAPAHRQMVLLYYVGGLTQKEIGRELAMPTRTVSYKLEEAVQRLRESLAKAGLAAALPLLAEGKLGEALVASQPAPQGLFDRVGDRIAQAPQANLATEASRRAAPVGGSPIAVAVFLVGVLAAGGAWLAASSQGEAPPSKPQPATTQSQLPPAAPEGIDITWTFEKGIPDDLQVYEGKLTPVQPAPDRVGVSSTIETPTFVRVDHRFPTLPLRIDLSLQLLKAKHSGYWGLMRAKDTILLTSDNWARGADIKDRDELIETTFYLFGQYNLKVTNGRVHAIRIYPKDTSGDRLEIGFMNAIVYKIRVRTIAPEDLPAEFREPEHFIQELGLIQTVKDGQPMPGHGDAP